MLTPEEFRDAHAMRNKGWSISVIARHLGRDRKTVRAYLTGQREPGQRRNHDQSTDPIGPYLEYCQTRLADDPHLAATILYTELAALGYQRDYRTFTRTLRERSLRPPCPQCAEARERRTSERKARTANAPVEPRTATHPQTPARTTVTSTQKGEPS